MPTRTLLRPGIVTTTQWTNGSPTLLSQADVSDQVTTITVPTTQRRVKPTDLFAFGTDLRVEVVSKASSLGVRRSIVSPYSYVEAIGPYLAWHDYDAAVGPSWRYLSHAVDFSDLYRKALMEIKSQKTNLAVSLAEVRESANLIGSLSSDLFQFFHKLRGGRPIAAFKALLGGHGPGSKRVANRWLEYTYGLSPMMSDIFGLCEQAGEKLTKGVYVHGRVKRRSSSAGRFKVGVATSMVTDVTRRRVIYRYKVDSTGLKTLSQLGFTNPLQFAWELIPYSFVIDWFIDIGDWVSCLDALVGVKEPLFLPSYEWTRRSKQEYKTADTVVPPCLEVNHRVVQRWAPKAQAFYGYPQYKPHLSVRRMLNATALLRQLL